MSATPAKAAKAYAYRQDAGSIAAQIYEHLMTRILDMDLRPFQELSEARLAAEFGVSRTPVREAFARLARRGLVEILPQRGTLISPLSEQQVARSRFIREALELPLARLAAEKITPEISAVLEREIALQRTYAEFADGVSFMQSDDRLHALIAKAAGYEAIWDDVREAKFHMDRVRRLSLLSTERMNDIVAEHVEIVSSISHGQPEAAEASIRKHLKSVFNDINVIRAKHPEYFSRQDGV